MKRQIKLISAPIPLIVFCVAAMPSPSIADTTIAANMTLTADTDWRADGVVTVPQGVTVDLNGPRSGSLASRARAPSPRR